MNKSEGSTEWTEEKVMVLEVLVSVSEMQSHVFNVMFDEDVWICKTPVFSNHLNTFFSFFAPIWPPNKKKRKALTVYKNTHKSQSYISLTFQKITFTLKRKGEKGSLANQKNKKTKQRLASVWTAHLRNAFRAEEFKSADRDVFGFSKTKHKSTVG